MAPDAPTPDPSPHSRACGWRAHPHGPECSTNCPTCHGGPMPDPSPDTPNVCPTCDDTGLVAPLGGRGSDGPDPCPHCTPAAGSPSPDVAADDWMVELTSSDPEPETYGTLVVDVDGGVWERTDKEGTRFGWSRVDDWNDDPRSWIRLAGNRGPVRLIRPLEAQAARITELEAAVADHTLTTPTEETE